MTTHSGQSPDLPCRNFSNMHHFRCSGLQNGKSALILTRQLQHYIPSQIWVPTWNKVIQPFNFLVNKSGVPWNKFWLENSMKEQISRMDTESIAVTSHPSSSCVWRCVSLVICCSHEALVYTYKIRKCCSSGNTKQMPKDDGNYLRKTNVDV
jgi:hypothetical protein